MKKFLLSLLFLFFALTIFCQAENNSGSSKEYYFKKAKNKRTVAWILLGGGTACFLGGGKISIDTYGLYRKTNFWDYVSIAGLVADITSIGFFASANHNKKRAVNIAITNQKLLRIQHDVIGFQTQPSMTIRIGL
ncbi:MAG: hypothetical protein ABIR50_11000 [Ginsengibacter sp.]